MGEVYYKDKGPNTMYHKYYGDNTIPLLFFKWLGSFSQGNKQIERPPKKTSGYSSEMEFTACFQNRVTKKGHKFS